MTSTTSRPSAAPERGSRSRATASTKISDLLGIAQRPLFVDAGVGPPGFGAHLFHDVLIREHRVRGRVRFDHRAVTHIDVNPGVRHQDLQGIFHASQDDIRGLDQRAGSVGKGHEHGTPVLDILPIRHQPLVGLRRQRRHLAQIAHLGCHRGDPNRLSVPAQAFLLLEIDRRTDGVRRQPDPTLPPPACSQFLA